MRKATIIGSLALLVIATALFAAPALSTSSSQEVTVQSLARQVRVLRNEVRGLRGQVKNAQTKARNAQLTAAAVVRVANEAATPPYVGSVRRHITRIPCSCSRARA